MAIRRKIRTRNQLPTEADRQAPPPPVANVDNDIEPPRSRRNEQTNRMLRAALEESTGAPRSASPLVQDLRDTLRERMDRAIVERNNTASVIFDQETGEIIEPPTVARGLLTDVTFGDPDECSRCGGWGSVPTPRPFGNDGAHYAAPCRARDCRPGQIHRALNEAKKLCMAANGYGRDGIPR
jgi:hypothetical protein